MDNGSSLSQTASSEAKCCICLSVPENSAFPHSCRSSRSAQNCHEFCFKCLLEWSKVKSECPLCKRTFKFIAYNRHRSTNGSEVYELYSLHGSQEGMLQIDQPSTSEGITSNYGFMANPAQVDRLASHSSQQSESGSDVQFPDSTNVPEVITVYSDDEEDVETLYDPINLVDSDSDDGVVLLDSPPEVITIYSSEDEESS